MQRGVEPTGVQYPIGQDQIPGPPCQHSMVVEVQIVIVAGLVESCRPFGGAVIPGGNFCVSTICDQVAEPSKREPIIQIAAGVKTNSHLVADFRFRRSGFCIR